MADTLFTTIERTHGDRPWGSVLDAGTGNHSLGWLCSLPTQRWTAITGDNNRQERMTGTFGLRMREEDRLLAGNWTDPGLLAGESFDVVIADYLLGAIDGFAPYFQDQLFVRLRQHVRPGGHLYVVGLGPYPDQADSSGGRLILEIARLRDACILLAGHRCYREYPREWVIRHLEHAGFTVEDAVSVPILYRERFINGQLNVCLRKLPLLHDAALAEQMGRHIEALREQALALPALQQGGIRFGHDYVVTACLK
jgi:hypothetical protein